MSANWPAVKHRGQSFVGLLSLTREPRQLRLVAKAPVRRTLDLTNQIDIALPLEVLPLNPIALALDQGTE